MTPIQAAAMNRWRTSRLLFHRTSSSVDPPLSAWTECPIRPEFLFARQLLWCQDTRPPTVQTSRIDSSLQS